MMQHISVIIHNKYNAMAKLKLKLHATFLGASEPFVNKESSEVTYRAWFQSRPGDEPFSVKSSIPFEGMKYMEDYEISVIQSASKYGVYYTADIDGLKTEEEV